MGYLRNVCDCEQVCLITCAEIANRYMSHFICQDQACVMWSVVLSGDRGQ